ncbi:MAG: hypothetical protein Fur002_06290 [Anaerolineales bacterium]
MRKLKERFPTFTQMAQAYAVAVIFLYAWSLMRFFWRMPSFLKYSTAGDIGVIFAYLMSFDFIESLIVVSAPLFISLALPARWWREKFAAKSAILLALGLWYLNYIYEIIAPAAPLPQALKWTPLVLLGIFAAAFGLGEIKLIQRIVEDFTDRLTVFLYISIPVSVICFLVVLFRNLF